MGRLASWGSGCGSTLAASAVEARDASAVVDEEGRVAIAIHLS